MPTSIRLLPFAAADGPSNMAADEVLLEAAQSGAASFRLYAWTQPTVSLGYFQSHRVRTQSRVIESLPFVRRSSGGAALVHHHEVTYALGLPAGPRFQSGSSWLCRMHGILAMALKSLGVGAEACRESTSESFQGLLCFHHFTPGDLLIDLRKVVGSAQRRQRGALLQHGGILLATSPFAPDLPGIRELTGKAIDPPDLCQAVVQSLREGTDWEVVPGEFSGDEKARIVQLVHDKYGCNKWNHKR